MNFQHTDDRQMLMDTLNRYVAEQYPFETRDCIAKSELGYSAEHWQQFADLGILGALFTDADGGYGGQGFDIAVVFECLGRGLVVEPALDTLMVGRAISLAGRDAHKTLIPGLINGSLRVAFAHDEPGSHYEATRVTTRAARDGDGWLLNGTKAVIQHGGSAQQFLVSARLRGADEDEAGIALFLLPHDAVGVRVRDYRKIDGGRAAELILNEVRLPAGALLGNENNGADTLEHALGFGVLALCAEALGAMDIAKQSTLDYLRSRKQFGVPIGSFQALQHRMADVLLEIEQARSAVINAAAALHSDRITRERALSAAKYTIGRIGTLVGEEVIQLHGGIGMTWELPLSHYAKRLVMIDHQLGDMDHHLERFIAMGCA